MPHRCFHPPRQESLGGYSEQPPNERLEVSHWFAYYSGFIDGDGRFHEAPSRALREAVAAAVIGKAGVELNLPAKGCNFVLM